MQRENVEGRSSANSRAPTGKFERESIGVEQPLWLGGSIIKMH